jgi:hypothetical protein
LTNPFRVDLIRLALMSGKTTGSTSSASASTSCTFSRASRVASKKIFVGDDDWVELASFEPTGAASGLTVDLSQASPDKF